MAKKRLLQGIPTRTLKALIADRKKRLPELIRLVRVNKEALNMEMRELRARRK